MPDPGGAWAGLRAILPWSAAAQRRCAVAVAVAWEQSLNHRHPRRSGMAAKTCELGDRILLFQARERFGGEVQVGRQFLVRNAPEQIAVLALESRQATRRIEQM